MEKKKEKIAAIAFRRQGLSYSEIMAQVPVAKSTLALWLQSVGLSKKQKQRLTEKKLASARRGALRKKQDRIFRSDTIKNLARMEIGKLTHREAWLIGAALYWAEGSKEKEWSPGSRTQFGNSDPKMIRFFLFWVNSICGISLDRIIPALYIHESHKDKVSSVLKFWSEQTQLPIERFKYVYFKRNKVNTKRKNIGEDYHGLLRLSIAASSELNRKISGWVIGMTENLPGGVLGNTPAFEAGDTRFEP
ncbi:MAG: hypothetical protein UU85_C0005G0012 [Candidatus Wolfebacteria bacterium GW2011_GWA2_42_10]|uniref:Uncharacterized protein n=2 Tax=Parcubacteria group TaxID=1794811 RepID=A0A0G0XL85_9BACT|nr:MAG: hypothetical protein UU85_C0005G0012 [Candidatus Wolfebacteria bacterium GW2011_GWA2_42_10]KKT90071.1 MAG: hypothetical protein UW90_C0007G0012 [Candidatus Yanofskybacteria bacterium GW2011_GWB1_45_11]